MLKTICTALLVTVSASVFSTSSNAGAFRAFPPAGFDLARTLDKPQQHTQKPLKIRLEADNGAIDLTPKEGLGLDGRIYDPIQDRGAQTLARFVELMDADTPGTYSIQVALPSVSGQLEYFWLKVTAHDHSSFSGLITNVPKIATQYSYGQAITVSRLEISDWMITSGSAIYGGYTMRPALKYFPKEKAETIRNLLKD